jgi:sugar phosphate isomerase/epimerase
MPVSAVANGMELTVGGLSLIDDDKERREAALARLLEHVDFAAELGALLIVGIMRGNIPRNADEKVYLARFTQSLERICEYAERKGVGVVLESIMRYINNYLCGVAETMDFICGLGRQNLSLHIDTHSMAVEEQNLVRSIRYCKGKPLGYVHYSDNNRMYPGGGALDFRALTHALADIGYDKYITVECLPRPTAEESARRALSYMKSIESMVMAERQYKQF